MSYFLKRYYRYYLPLRDQQPSLIQSWISLTSAIQIPWGIQYGIRGTYLKGAVMMKSFLLQCVEKEH